MTLKRPIRVRIGGNHRTQDNNKDIQRASSVAKQVFTSPPPPGRPRALSWIQHGLVRVAQHA